VPKLRRALLVAGIPILAVTLYAVLAPDVIGPAEAWRPDDPPELEGVLAENDALSAARVVCRGKIAGPESIGRNPTNGQLITGLKDGRLVRIDLAQDEPVMFTRTGTAVEGCGAEEHEKTCGRVLGARFDAEGRLFVADAFKGLLAVSADGKTRVLSREANGVPFAFTDDLDIAKDGRIYFSDASSKWDRTHYRQDILENHGWGRLLRYDPSSEKTEVLLDGLYFANGVQLAEDESYVIVAETGRYRLRRYYLQGEKAGTTDILIDNLPGSPDNVRRAKDGGYWVAMGAKRSKLIDFLHARPTMKRVFAKLIPLKTMQELVVPKVGFVLKLDRDGRIVKSYWDSSGQVITQVSEADEYDGKLYVGSIAADRIAVLDL
jgi:sugar lactone lactonase YvrE